MSVSVGRFVIERLRSGWGVSRVYGYPGDGVNGLLAGFHDERAPEFVQVRHEEIAAFAATAHAKLTDEPGVCLSTSGPGAIHLLNGLYDAKLDHQPVVALVGQQARSAMGSDYQQEVDLLSLFKDVASEYVQVCMDASQARHLVDRAFRIALATRSPTCVIFPNDVQELDYAEPPRAHGYVRSTAGRSAARVTPSEDELHRAARVLADGERVAILAGAGARGAARELAEIAELLGAGVAKALNGRDVLPDDLPYVTGPIGLLGSTASWELMQGCDTLLMVGTGFPYAEFLPEPGRARCVQIDLDPRRLGMRYPTEVALAGDSGPTLRALIGRLERRADRSWRAEVEREVTRWWDLLAARAGQAAEPVNPEHVFAELATRLPDRCITTGDSGSVTVWWARHLKLREGMRSALSGGLATMGPALPYGLAAKLAHPDRPVVACLGDGAFQMLGMNALLDVARYAGRFADPTFVTLVLNDRDLNMVTWEQRVLAGDPKLEASQVLGDFPYARFAELCGLAGWRVQEPGGVGPALDAAFAAGRPAVVEVVTDPEIPPLPPHVTLEQTRNLASAVVHGDRARGRVVRNALRGKLQEILRR